MRWGRWTLLAAASLATGCGGAAEDPQAAVLQELRALRAAVAPTSVDDKALAAALAPVLDRLRGLQEQHADLRDQFVRWSMQGQGAPVAAPGAPPDRTAAPQTPAQDPAVTARLQELEQRLQAQQQRQDELEALVQRSLDGTSQRVEQVLLQLQALGGNDAGTAAASAADQRSSAANPADAAAGPPPAAEPVAPTAASGDAALTDAERTARAEQQQGAFQLGRARMQQAWLVAVLTVGLGVIGFLAWRLLRTPRRPPQSQAKSAASGEMTTDELWAAAGLLSEAVGRLRGSAPEAPPPPRNAAAPAPAAGAPVASTGKTAVPDFGPDDVFVLDDEGSLLGSVDFGAEATPLDIDGTHPAAAPPPPEPQPVRWSTQLQTRDPAVGLATIDAYLRHDPRVLQRPAPVVRRSGSQLLVECALLPGLLPGESEHLRATMQRLLQQL